MGRATIKYCGPPLPEESGDVADDIHGRSARDGEWQRKYRIQ